MARRSRDSEPPVSLFPFLSVLASVMGALILALCGAVVGQMDTSEDKGTRDAVAAAGAREGIRLAEAREKELEALMAKAADVALQVERLKRAAERLKKETDSSATDTEKLNALLAQLAQLRERIEEKEERLRQLSAEIERIKKAIADQKTKITEPPSLAIVGPRGSKGLTPCFIECKSDEVILHPDGTSVPKANIENSPELASLIAKIQQNRGQGWTAVLLVRPDGVRTHDMTMARLRDADVPRGALPVPGQRKLDLSMWFKKTP